MVTGYRNLSQYVLRNSCSFSLEMYAGIDEKKI